MGKRYGMLPSQILNKGDSFDLMTFDVAMNYQLLQTKKANKEDITSMYDQNQLQEIMNKARGQHG